MPARRTARLLPLLLAGCGAIAQLKGYDGRWTGMLKPEAGTCQPSHATLTVGGRAFSFAPDDGVLVLHGTIAPDDTLHAVLPLLGPNHTPFPLTLDGRLSRTGFTGLYTTPKCRAEVTLSPAG